MHNRIDWCVRGYSHGFYNRGQDSAGLLMYEQSSNNVVAYNSVTHGGDGLFLWAGQSTMDTGQGGANDNLFYRNDFSHAPTNGIEATFSRNTFLDNRVEEYWHGVWGGYSYDSWWSDNTFARNTEGWRSSTARGIASRKHFRRRRDGHPAVAESDAGPELGISEEPRYARAATTASSRTRSPGTRLR